MIIRRFEYPLSYSNLEQSSPDAPSTYSLGRIMRIAFHCKNAAIPLEILPCYGAKPRTSALTRLITMQLHRHLLIHPAIVHFIEDKYLICGVIYRNLMFHIFLILSGICRIAVVLNKPVTLPTIECDPRI